MSPSLVVVRGRSPIVLVAPHAGRRDAAQRPWGHAPLKMNDLHTGSLTQDLARRLDASAVVNDGGDRNDVDLARITAAHDHAPHFLAEMASALEDAVGRHGHAVLLAIHGWNVVQPAVDLGLGATPDDEAFVVGPDAAVSQAFATTTLRALMAALGARGIAASPGLRYPGRARENLLQLFTRRHRDDARPLVRRLTALAGSVDAVQLELSLPLRIPGRWRDGFVDACAAAFGDAGDVSQAPWIEPAGAVERTGLEFVAGGLAGLAALDEFGARLLLFPDDGTLVTFTGERIGAHGPMQIAGLRLRASDDALELSYDGPMLRFPDTTPFLDLEQGLAGASVLDARVDLRFVAAHGGDEGPCPFGAVSGRATLAGIDYHVRGHGVRARRGSRFATRPRAALHGPAGAFFVDGKGAGFVCRGERHAALESVEITTLGGSRLRVCGEHHDGTPLVVEADLGHRLPVVRGGAPAGRLLFAVCHGERGLCGWAELPGD